MDKQTIRLTTSIAAPALDSFSLSTENPEEISAPCLLTYLDDQMGDLSQDTQ